MSAPFAPPQNQNQAVAKRQTTPLDIMMSKLAKDNEATKAEISLVLPKGADVDRVLSEARLYIMAHPSRDYLLACTPVSILTCIKKAASCGLSLDGRNCHLVPYGQSCQFQIDYKGLITLVKRNKTVSVIFAERVYTNDTFRMWVDECGKHLMWEPNLQSNDRGDFMGCFAFVKFPDGGIDWEWMTDMEIEAIGKRSKAYTKGPWVTDRAEMERKTPLRRLTKRLDLDPVVVKALESDDDALDVDSEVTTEGAQPQQMFAPTPPQAPKALPKAKKEPTQAQTAPVDPEPPQSEPEPTQATEPQATTATGADRPASPPLVLETDANAGAKAKPVTAAKGTDYLKALKDKAKAANVSDTEIIAYMRFLKILGEEKTPYTTLDEVSANVPGSIRAICLSWEQTMKDMYPDQPTLQN